MVLYINSYFKVTHSKRMYPSCPLVIRVEEIMTRIGSEKTSLGPQQSREVGHRHRAWQTGRKQSAHHAFLP
jgi:hypothetical protein